MEEAGGERADGVLQVVYRGFIAKLRYGDEIEAAWQIVSDPPECLAEEAFSPISANGAPNPPADGDTQAGLTHFIDSGVEGDPPVRQAMAKPQDADELLARSDTRGTWQSPSQASLGHERDYTDCRHSLPDHEPAAILGKLRASSILLWRS
jgi:hypothetical protein